MSGRADSKHNWLVWLCLKCALSLSLLGAVFVANRSAFITAVTHRPALSTLLMGLLLYLNGVMLAFMRWHVLVRALDLPFSRSEAFRLGWIGMFFNIVIPGAVGGDVVKAAYIARQQHHKGRAIASVVIDRLVGLVGLFILAAVFGAWAWSSFDRRVGPIVVSACIALAITVLLLAAAFLSHPHGPIARRLSSRPKLAHLFAELHATGVAYRRRFAWVLLAAGMATLTHLANVAAFALVARAFSAGESQPNLLGFLTIVPLVLFSTAIPLPFSGLGASESVSAILFRAVDYSGGAVAMIGFRMLQLVAATIGVIVYLTHRAELATTVPAAEPLGQATDSRHADLGVVDC